MSAVTAVKVGALVALTAATAVGLKIKAARDERKRGLAKGAEEQRASVSDFFSDQEKKRQEEADEQQGQQPPTRSGVFKAEVHEAWVEMRSQVADLKTRIFADLLAELLERIAKRRGEAEHEFSLPLLRDSEECPGTLRLACAILFSDTWSTNFAGQRVVMDLRGIRLLAFSKTVLTAEAATEIAAWLLAFPKLLRDADPNPGPLDIANGDDEGFEMSYSILDPSGEYLDDIKGPAAERIAAENDVCRVCFAYGNLGFPTEVKLSQLEAEQLRHLRLFAIAVSDLTMFVFDPFQRAKDHWKALHGAAVDRHVNRFNESYYAPGGALSREAEDRYSAAVTKSLEDFVEQEMNLENSAAFLSARDTSMLIVLLNKKCASQKGHPYHKTIYSQDAVPPQKDASSFFWVTPYDISGGFAFWEARPNSENAESSERVWGLIPATCGVAIPTAASEVGGEGGEEKKEVDWPAVPTQGHSGGGGRKGKKKRGGKKAQKKAGHRWGAPTSAPGPPTIYGRTWETRRVRREKHFLDLGYPPHLGSSWEAPAMAYTQGELHLVPLTVDNFVPNSLDEHQRADYIARTELRRAAAIVLKRLGDGRSAVVKGTKDDKKGSGASSIALPPPPPPESVSPRDRLTGAGFEHLTALGGSTFCCNFVTGLEHTMFELQVKQLRSATQSAKLKKVIVDTICSTRALWEVDGEDEATTRSKLKVDAQAFAVEYLELLQVRMFTTLQNKLKEEPKDLVARRSVEVAASHGITSGRPSENKILEDILASSADGRREKMKDSLIYSTAPAPLRWTVCMCAVSFVLIGILGIIVWPVFARGLLLLNIRGRLSYDLAFSVAGLAVFVPAAQVPYLFRCFSVQCMVRRIYKLDEDKDFRTAAYVWAAAIFNWEMPAILRVGDVERRCQAQWDQWNLRMLMGKISRHARQRCITRDEMYYLLMDIEAVATRQHTVKKNSGDEEEVFEEIRLPATKDLEIVLALVVVDEDAARPSHLESSLADRVERALEVVGEDWAEEDGAGDTLAAVVLCDAPGSGGKEPNDEESKGGGIADDTSVASTVVEPPPRIGTRVEISNIQKKPSLNGKRAIVIPMRISKPGRIGVSCLEDGKPVDFSLNSENVRAADLRFRPKTHVSCRVSGQQKEGIIVVPTMEECCTHLNWTKGLDDYEKQRHFAFHSAMPYAVALFDISKGANGRILIHYDDDIYIKRADTSRRLQDRRSAGEKGFGGGDGANDTETKGDAAEANNDTETNEDDSDDESDLAYLSQLRTLHSIRRPRSVDEYKQKRVRGLRPSSNIPEEKQNRGSPKHGGAADRGGPGRRGQCNTLDEELEEGGWTKVRAKKHIIYKRKVPRAGGGNTFVTSKTPSCRRTAKNELAQLRRLNQTGAVTVGDMVTAIIHTT